MTLDVNNDSLSVSVIMKKMKNIMNDIKGYLIAGLVFGSLIIWAILMVMRIFT